VAHRRAGDLVGVVGRDPLLRDLELDAALRGGLGLRGDATEALERLRFTVEIEGIAALVAEPGCGKSLLLGQLADELQKQGHVVHYFAHATVGPFGLVNVLARKTGIAPRRSRAETALAVSQKLLEDERKHLLVLDEVHVMPDDSLEDIRLLSIADFDRKSPFGLILAGPPALDDRLAEPPPRARSAHHHRRVRISLMAITETGASRSPKPAMAITGASETVIGGYFSVSASSFLRLEGPFSMTL
jgi:type II secretory pathway predicted ATPase ExeA